MDLLVTLCICLLKHNWIHFEMSHYFSKVCRKVIEHCLLAIESMLLAYILLTFIYLLFYKLFAALFSKSTVWHICVTYKLKRNNNNNNNNKNLHSIFRCSTHKMSPEITHKEHSLIGQWKQIQSNLINFKFKRNQEFVHVICGLCYP